MATRCREDGCDRWASAGGFCGKHRRDYRVDRARQVAQHLAENSINALQVHTARLILDALNAPEPITAGTILRQAFPGEWREEA